VDGVLAVAATNEDERIFDPEIGVVPDACLVDQKMRRWAVLGRE